MLKNELKAALAVLGTMCVPFTVQADQSMDTTQAPQQPGYVSGEMVRAGQLPGAYNQSATYMCDSGWDVFVTGDYIWWDWAQDEGLQGGRTTIRGLDNFEFSPKNITPGYASGFQVGLGFNMHGMDDWNFYTEYTWYKNSGSGSGSLYLDEGVILQIPAADSIHVNMHYNNLDFLLQRPFYFGKKLTSNFYAGLKSLWISQKYNLDVEGEAIIFDGAIDVAIDADLHRKVTSWALGPKFGVDSNWLLGYGLKILTNISASVLYTRYTQHSNLDLDIFGDAFDTDFSFDSDSSISVPNYGTLRPVVETYLGLGWGSYFCDNDFHLDLSVGYDFNVYFNYVTHANQNGMGNGANMYLHGLNVQARFDF